MTRLGRWIGATVAAAALSVAAEAAVVTRGPYLQKGTPTSVVVRWRTDVATDSRVSYGSAPGSLDASVDDLSVRTEHEVEVTGLAPATTYYYSVGTRAGRLAGDDTSHFFRTPPLAGTAVPFRIWVLGDSGTADASARAVRDAYYAFTGSRHTDLWLMLGDNAYEDGTDGEYQAAVFDTFPRMLRKSVLWPTFGNHEAYSADSGTQSGVYYDVFTLPRNAEAGGVASGTEAYYSFDHANVHFVVLDSSDSDRSSSGAMLTWLREDLLSTTRDWTIAFWHHPPYSRGWHDSDVETESVEMRENALPILEAAGVDLVLAGHNHDYERSFLLDGHYGASSTLTAAMVLDGGDGRPEDDGAYDKPSTGPAAHEGTVYASPGSSGWAGGGPLDHPAMCVSLKALGSLVLDVDGLRLDATFLDSAGAVRDTFTIRKGVSPPNVAPTVDAGPDLAATEGAGVELAASFADANVGDVHAATIDWGDGSPVEAGAVDAARRTVTGAHVYADDGAYTATVVVDDGRGGTGQDDAGVTVANVPPTAVPGGPYAGVARRPITFNGSASDPGADALTFEWDFSYDEAEGFLVEAVGPTVPHTYPRAGTHTVALRVADDDASTLVTTTATVAGRPPVRPRR